MSNGDNQTASTVKYRCVCGDDTLVHLVEGGGCENCGRDISADMLLSNVSQTIEIPSCGSVSASSLTNITNAMTPENDLTGETLGHYRIIRPLGHGGMGTVYQALDESLQRYVALKVIKQVCKTSGDLDRLMQEARAQARVNHPNVVHIYYVSRDEENPFLAMELVNGPTLANRIRDEKLPYPEIVRIAIETAQALRQSARFDIVHGDIKPTNILLEEGKLVKLSDFGLSRRISETTDDVTSISGTPAYMAPEITRGIEPSILSDQYSLGVMLFQLTFGRLPYTVGQDSVSAMITAHQNSPVEFPKPWPKDLPDEWKHVLTRLLAKEPDSRFDDYDQLIETLQRARPLNLPKAGLVVRGIAWTADILIAMGIVGLFQIPWNISFVERIADDFPPLYLLLSATTFLGPLAIAFFQARWNNSPAKKLMQIRIVDEHGLKPSKPILIMRALFQLAPIWAAATFITMERVDLDSEWVGGVFSTVYSLFLLVSVAFLVFSKRKLALHDRLFGTRVCLDAGSTEIVA